ncbi:MAG TPA: FHA domain-containing protein [Thermoanaerobaculia bacterium]|nr:FHA domain-containing protein [Thermoanaerobaculia bacterium]
MADKRCENGHFIDEAWDICPYCPAESGEQEIPVVRPSRAAASAPAPEPVRPLTAVPQPRREAVLPSPAPVPPAVTAAPIERTVAVMKPGAEPVRRYVVGWLVGLNGPNRGESFPVRIGRNVLGRDRRSDIVLTDDQASSHHADLVFRPEERRFILMDHNSTNGTYVNETEIEPRRDLAGNDVIRIGLQKFLFMPLIREGFYWDDEGALQ